MKKEQLELIRGSGNIYRDFNIADADVRQLKAILAAEIIRALDRGELSVRKAQGLTGIDAGDFSRVRNADFRRISVERLMAMINGLGSRVRGGMPARLDSTRMHTLKFGLPSWFPLNKQHDCPVRCNRGRQRQRRAVLRSFRA
jgi:hypothetical protein